MCVYGGGEGGVQDPMDRGGVRLGTLYCCFLLLITIYRFDYFYYSSICCEFNLS